MQFTRQYNRVAAGTAGAGPELAGSWRGLMLHNAGTVESFNLQRETPDNLLPGAVQRFTTPGGIATDARLLEASDRTVVILVGPYADPETRTTVVTVFEGVHDSQGMEGVFCTRRHGGRTVVRSGRFTAAPVETVNKAA